MKTQNIRLADVYIIGPLMIWGGLKLREDNPFYGNALLLSGIGTVLYNGRNYLKVRREGLVPGGYAAGKKPSDFDPAALRVGVKVEMEHTTDPAIAREIAMDHLVEDPNYYAKLQKAGL